MTCSQCGYEFCWICGHEWQTHEGSKYNCNEFKDLNMTTEEGRKDARASHYSKHYFGHLTAKRRFEENHEEIRAHLQMICDTNPKSKYKGDSAKPQIDCIIDAIKKGRSVLMWSYAYAYLENFNDSDRKLFEYMQQQCEKTIEKLCYMIEVQKLRALQRIHTASTLLDKQVDALLKHVSISDDLPE